jgi:hypothetical protein
MYCAAKARQTALEVRADQPEMDKRNLLVVAQLHLECRCGALELWNRLATSTSLPPRSASTAGHHTPALELPTCNKYYSCITYTALFDTALLPGISSGTRAYCATHSHLPLTLLDSAPSHLGSETSALALNLLYKPFTRLRLPTQPLIVILCSRLRFATTESPSQSKRVGFMATTSLSLQ